jgi:5-methylcytosine-specific restriction protein A
LTKKLCTYVGCKSIVDHNNDGTSPRCTDHPRNYTPEKTQERQRKYAHHYNEKGQNIYSTWRWKKLRKAKAERNPLCEHCYEYGIAKKVEEVDHKNEIEDGGAVWDIENLQSLCKRCHLIKTDKCKQDRERKVDDWGYRI